ncbi:BhlA/UviB family holin-like peptide, partial [Brevibacterium sp. SIMBA_078]
MTQGPFAVLFCWVLFYVLNTTKERENKLNEQIDAQNDVLA